MQCQVSWIRLPAPRSCDEIVGFSKCADSAESDPEPPAGRDWLVLEETPTAAESAPEKFTAFSYNILCDKYATKSQYGYAPARVLDWQTGKKSSWVKC